MGAGSGLGCIGVCDLAGGRLLGHACSVAQRQLRHRIHKTITGILFFTDFRYTERAEQRGGGGLGAPRRERELLPQIAGAMRRPGRLRGRASSASASTEGSGRGSLTGVELVAAGELVEELRRGQGRRGG